jgi:hypothetical protein
MRRVSNLPRGISRRDPHAARRRPGEGADHTGIRAGVLFLPFHYGYWDTGEPTGDQGERAANEPTLTDWDPVSKQPLFKTAAATITHAGGRP